MVAYTRDEIISASEVARNFSQILNSLKTKERFAISKNNKLEAVLIDIDEYELLKSIYDKLEDSEIEYMLESRSEEEREVSHSKIIEI